MKIIHTADWHLCDRLGRIDRTLDLRVRVEKVAALCSEHDVDVLVIAGDLFSEQATLDDMTAALNHLRQHLQPFFAKGGTLLAITGNHDRDSKINIVRAGMSLAVPPTVQSSVLPGGRMYLANGTIAVTLQDRRGQKVQFVLVPYPFASRYNLDAGEYRTKEEENQLLRGKVSTWLKETASKIDVTLPTVLVGHLHVRGSEMHTLYKLTDREDVLFDFAELQTAWAYVALGHIHKPQMLGGAPHVRYPGSLDRLDFGERHTDHGVWMLDIDGANAVVPVHLPLPATPFHEITIDDPDAEIPTLGERYPDHATAIVKISVRPNNRNLSNDEILKRLRQFFPRWYSIDIQTPATVAHAARTFQPQASFEATVRSYLTQQLADDNDKEALLELADTFLSHKESA